ncbi:MAG: D-tyrosyl-tRNA(Tyr) deacylase [Chitinivibrionales bacterium]|nr:D-tyrosyl-tRNA(Tyr) deacylase [Chitinivibrionales bacterium]MBD3395365.1 D-tyrosyl-tRNA(Tyr) deacylase [Chitinivibrionales bacterium]
MRIVLQRVKQARVRIDDAVVASIGPGILVLLGVHAGDTPDQSAFLAAKCADLRIFPDSEGKMNRSVTDTRGQALVVSQFTLYGDCRKGRRPSYTQAAPPAKGEELYERFVEQLKNHIPDVQTGRFGAMMDVELINDGPVTLILDKEAPR